MAVWNCQAVGKLNLANRVYAKDQLQLCESGEVRLFIQIEMLNIGQQISSMHQNPTENRSKISGGTSKFTTVALSSVAVLRDARDAKK
jgi:hypothetical protein